MPSRNSPLRPPWSPPRSGWRHSRRYGLAMDSASYLDHLRRDLGAFEACLAGDLSARVRHCGTWTLYDLADHLGQGNLWAAAGVTEQRGDYESDPAPRENAALARW